MLRLSLTSTRYQNGLVNNEYLKHSLKKYGEKDRGSDLTVTQVQHYEQSDCDLNEHSKT